jgi:phosphopantetheinyl transferase (holo-ACP synthase)
MILLSVLARQVNCQVWVMYFVGMDIVYKRVIRHAIEKVTKKLAARQRTDAKVGNSGVSEPHERNAKLFMENLTIS